MLKAVTGGTTGHPDRICDQIADAIVDAYIKRDKTSRLAIRVLGSRGMIMIGGTVISKADFDCAEVARRVYQNIGYTDDIEVFVNIDVYDPKDEKALRPIVEPVTVNGYATRATRERLPRAQVFATNIIRRLEALRETDPAFTWLLPDVSLQLIMQGQDIHTIGLRVSHTQEIALKDVKTSLFERLAQPLVQERGKVFINAQGACHEAGFQRCAGGNGVLSQINAYGGLIPHGSGVPSGKDPWHPDRAGAYMARKAARYIVDKELAEAALVTAVYVPGRQDPVMLTARGIGKKAQGSKMDMTQLVRRQFDFRLDAIVEEFSLHTAPRFQILATQGPFGQKGFAWEEVD